MSRRAELSAAANMLVGAAGVVATVVTWYFAVQFGFVSPISVPPPIEVGKGLGDLIIDPRFHPHVIDTLATWAAGVSLTAAVVIPIGLLIGSAHWLEKPTFTVIHAARSVPATALIPISILLFGLGFEMKLALICYAVTWPLVINTIYGAKDVDSRTLAVARSLRWGPRKIFVRVTLPSAAPFIATGLRISAAIGFVVAVGAEILGASMGIGTVMVRYAQSEMPDFVYASIIVVGVLGIMAYGFFLFIERRLVPWSAAYRE